MPAGPGALSEVLVTETVSCLNRAVEKLRSIWEEIGMPEDLQLERTQAVKEHIKVRGDVYLFLDARAQEVLLKQKRDRKQELKTLQERDRDLCDILCTAPFRIDSDSVPSLEDLDLYRRHLAALSLEKEQRQEQFISTKRQIILLMEELDHTPDTSFEEDVVCKDEEAFCLSEDNIAALQSLLQQLEAQRSLNADMCAELRSRIAVLWERLQVPVEERELSAVHTAGSSAKTRKALQLEVNTLEELMLQNLKSVIPRIRAELADYWDKCFYSQEQREGFSPYYDEDYTETLLELHAAEVRKMKSHYETHKALFEAIWKWEETWRMFLDLERKANDPSRYTNRGGNLLKEEKQRVKLQKVLAKLQEELDNKIQAFEQAQEKPFLVKGQQFMEYVKEQWQLYHLEKEKEKQERRLKKSRQMKEEVMYGSTPQAPLKRWMLSPHVPAKVRKVNGLCQELSPLRGRAWSLAGLQGGLEGTGKGYGCLCCPWGQQTRCGAWCSWGFYLSFPGTVQPPVLPHVTRALCLPLSSTALKSPAPHPTAPFGQLLGEPPASRQRLV
uniref:Protein regulator of cytokinesis 1 n=1 Tax=Calidris pygmaea TaxID=425635 RepID=A0A8C3JR67_9CHAR